MSQNSGMKPSTAPGLAAASALVLGASATAAPPPASSAYGPSWSAAHADAANTDYLAVPGARDLELAWSRRFEGGSINLGATTDARGRVYVTTTAPGCHLYVLDQKTGETIWCSQAVNRSAVSSSALLDRDGRIYLSDNEAMVAFDGDGKVLWRTPIVGFTLSAQFTPQGHLIFVTHVGRIYVLRRDTGAPVLAPVELIPGATYDPRSADQPVRACMRGTEDCPAANTIAIDERTGRFFFTFWDKGAKQAGLRAMRYAEDPVPRITPLWTNDTLPGGSGSSPDLTADGTRLYVNDNLDSVHAVEAATGRAIWRFPIGWASGGSPSTSPEGIIIPTGGGPLMAIADRGDHAELLWRDDARDNRSIAAQAAGGLAYPAVARARGENDLTVVDVRTGAELDRVPLPGRTMFTVGTTFGLDGSVYVATILGQLFALRPTAPAAGDAGRSPR